MVKAAVLGEYDSIYGFASIGLSIVPVSTTEEAEEAFRRLVDEQAAVIYVTESTAAKIQRLIDHYRTSELPAVILIPGIAGNTGAGVANVKKSVEQAIGSDILFNDMD